MTADTVTGRPGQLGKLDHPGKVDNPEGPMRDDEMTPQQVADLLGVSPSTVRRWEDRGILSPARRLPGSGYRRYDRAEVERLLNNPPEESA